MTAIDDAFWLTTFREHGSSILAFLTSRLGRRDLAEDLLQETFVRAMRKETRLADAGRMRTYLMTIAYHLVIDQRRKKRPALFSEVSEHESRSLEERPAVDVRSPEATADLHRLEQHLRTTLRSLRPTYRVAFEQAVLEQRSYAEIAETQGWTLQQVKINVYRARKKVLARLGDILCPNPEIPS